MNSITCSRYGKGKAENPFRQTTSGKENSRILRNSHSILASKFYCFIFGFFSLFGCCECIRLTSVLAIAEVICIIISDDHCTMQSAVLMTIVVAQEVVSGSATSFHLVLWMNITFAALYVSQVQKMLLVTK